MMKQNFKLLLLIFLLSGISFPFVAGSKNNSDSDWLLAKESEDILLSYRWIELNDGSKTREMKVEFTVKAGMQEIIRQFSTPENYLQWAAGIKECEIEKENDLLWYTHTIMNYPWPLRKKDLITRYLIEKNRTSTSIFTEAAPEYKSELKGIERMKDYYGSWILIRNEDGTTSVEYRVVSYGKPVFPRAIQDPVIQRITINSISELRELAEAS